MEKRKKSLLRAVRDAMRVRTKETLIYIAVISALIASAEGFIYYADIDNLFFRILLILQNSIKAFGLRANIGLQDALSAMQADPTLPKMCISYAYGFAVFAAPYCTAAAIYKLLVRLLDLFSSLRRKWFKPGKANSVIMFGYNEDTRRMLNSLTPGAYRIHLVTDREIPQEERYRLIRKGCRTTRMDFQHADDVTLHHLFAQVELPLAERVLLFEESAVRNFSLYCSLAKELRQKPKWQGKLFFRCEDEGIIQLLQNYYDSTASEEKKDLQIVSLPELQIRQLYQEQPLHTYYQEMDPAPPLERWDVHLLILGFGKLGQQALLQAMNQGVVHHQNRIHIDVVDYDMEKKQGVFSSRFRTSAVQGSSRHLEVQKSCADGSLTMDFHQMDCRYQAFQQLLEKMGAVPYTYIVIALEDPDVSMQCLTEVRRYLGERSVPIAVRMDSNHLLAQHISKASAVFRDVRLIPSPADVLKLKTVFQDDLDQVAKEAHKAYSAVSFGGQAVPWEHLSLTKRNANRAQAYHRKVASRAFREYDADRVRAELDRLLTRREGQWQYADGIADDRAFVKALEGTLCLEAARMEHRRWCYDYISRGWEYNAVRDDESHCHDCLLDWDTLAERRANTCKYDLTPLIAEFYYQRGEAH